MRSRNPSLMFSYFFWVFSIMVVFLFKSLMYVFRLNTIISWWFSAIPICEVQELLDIAQDEMLKVSAPRKSAIESAPMMLIQWHSPHISRVRVFFDLILKLLLRTKNTRKHQWLGSASTRSLGARSAAPWPWSTMKWLQDRWPVDPMENQTLEFLFYYLYLFEHLFMCSPNSLSFGFHLVFLRLDQTW